MSEQIDYNKIHSLTIFKDLDRNELEKLQRFIFIKNTPKDCFLFSQGMMGELLYVIISGRVEIVKNTKDNKKLVLATMGPNEIIGEMSLIDSAPRSATGKTIENSVMLGITKKSFNELLDIEPRIAAKIMMSLLKIMSNRLRVTTNAKVDEIFS
jgi:CRP/FNR family transcriptional regulator, cyclic AMP receptor protein